MIKREVHLFLILQPPPNLVPPPCSLLGLEQFLKLSILAHLHDNVAPTNELPVNVKLGDGRPVAARSEATRAKRMLVIYIYICSMLIFPSLHSSHPSLQPSFSPGLGSLQPSFAPAVHSHLYSLIPSLMAGYSSTLTELKLAPCSWRTPTTRAEKPHWGALGEPFMYNIMGLVFT